MEIEEAYRKLGETLRWPGRVAMSREVDPADTDLGWFEEEQAAARALALAVFEEAKALEQYTCHVACDHGEECRTTRRDALRARIERLGE